MNKSKKLTAAAAVSAVATALVAPAAFAATGMTDIDGSYAKDAIMELVDKGIINGKGDGMFDPTGKIERQDFAIILAKALGLDVSSAPATATFSDVPTTHYAFKYVEAAAKAGLIHGEGAGMFGAGHDLSRQDMAVLFVRALGVDATGKGMNLKFSDAGHIADYAKDAVAEAVELGLISGNPDGTFNPAGNAERQAVALVASKFLKQVEMKAMAQLTGATAVDTNTVTLTFSKAVTDLKAADVAVAAKATGAAVTVSNVTLSADKMSATVKLNNALASGTTYTVTFGGKTVEFTTAAKVAVTNVTALNLKQVKVEFSGEVDQTTAEMITNYTLTGAGFSLTDMVDTAQLAADGKSVVLTLVGSTHVFMNQTSYKLSVSNLKDKAGVALDNVVDKTFTAFDNTVPTAKDVTVVGPNSLKVTFSAPIDSSMNSGGTYALDNGSVSVSKMPAQISGTEYSVVINVGANLAEGSHTLVVSGQTGYNGLKVTEQTLTFNYAKDTVAPTASVVSVKLYNNSGTIQTKAVIQFSEPVATGMGGTLQGGTVFGVYNNMATYQGTAMATTDAKTFVSNNVTYADKFEVTFNSVFPTGTINFFVNNVSETDNNSKIQDAWGNTFTTAVLQGVHTIDTAKPVVNSAKYTTTAGNNVVVEFSKTVDTATATANANYTFLMEDGTPVTGTGFDGAGHPTATIAPPTDNKVTIPVTLPAGNITLKITKVQDTVAPTANVMDDASLVIAVADTAAPTVDKALYTSDLQSLFVYFNKAMDTASITDLTNYAFGTTLLSNVSGTTAMAINNNTAVKISFSSKQTGVLVDNAPLTFGHLKDAKGNYTAALQNTLMMHPDAIATATDIINVKAIAADTITFEVKQPLSGIDASMITLKLNAQDGSGLYTTLAGQAFYMNQKVNNGATDGALVTVKLPSSATVAQKLYSDKSNLDSVVLATGALTNANGNNLDNVVTINAVAVIDAIAPMITGAVESKVSDVDANGRAYNHLSTIDVTFSEAMKASTVGLDSFTVNGYTVTDVQPTLIPMTSTAKTFKIVLKANQYDDTALTPTVTLVKAAKDANDVVINPQTSGVTPTKSW